MTGLHVAVVTLFFHQHDMKTVLRAERLADAVHRGVINRLLQGIDVTERSDPS